MIDQHSGARFHSYLTSPGLLSTLPNFLDLISKPRSLSLPTGHMYSYLRPLLSPYKVDEQFFPLKSTHWENFLLPLSLVSPLNEAILHQWVTFE